MLASEPRQAAVLLMLAYCLEHDGKADEALSTTRQAVEAEPDNFRALKALADAYVKAGNHQHAKPYVERALLAARALPKPRWDDRGFALLTRLSVAALRLVPRYRRRIPRGSPHDFHGEAEVAKWTDWAQQYLQWYGAVFPGNEGVTSS
jgi:tetratricopeptide (TPR) repeat protein